MFFGLKSKRTKSTFSSSSTTSEASLPHRMDRRAQLQKIDEAEMSSRTDSTWASFSSSFSLEDPCVLEESTNELLRSPKRQSTFEDLPSEETALSTVPSSMCSSHSDPKSLSSSTKSVRFAEKEVWEYCADPQRDNCPRQHLLWH